MRDDGTNHVLRRGDRGLHHRPRRGGGGRRPREDGGDDRGPSVRLDEGEAVISPQPAPRSMGDPAEGQKMGVHNDRTALG